MNIADNYPNFEDFCKNEFKTLEYLRSRTILKDYSELETSISNYYNEYFGLLKNNENFDFNFHCDFTMEVEGHFHKIIVGANVKMNYSECSYFLAVVGKDGDNDKLIRKFHFDYAIPSTSTNQKVPIYHLQYGGELSPAIGELGISGSKLDSWLSLPRLNFYPVNLALLLDTLFCEFRTEETNKVVENSEWRSLIFKNEELLTKNYFCNIYTHLNSQNHKRDNLLRDFCYGD